MPTYQYKNQSIDFVTGFLISTNWKKKTYNSILVIVDHLIKIVHYKLVQIMINAPSLAKDIIDMVIQYHELLNSIINNGDLIFTSKF